MAYSQYFTNFCFGSEVIRKCFDRMTIMFSGNSHMSVSLFYGFFSKFGPVMAAHLSRNM
jgi:hypothetical protein